jgi:hypothetical protein
LTYQPPASSTFLSEQTSQQYFYLRKNQHQSSVTSQTNKLSIVCVTRSRESFLIFFFLFYLLCRVGVVFSGRQSPGGHNVVWGLHDALKAYNPQSVLYGFVGNQNHPSF